MLHRLPKDGDVSELRSLQLDESTPAEIPQPSQDDLYGAHLASSFVPNATQQRTEEETVYPRPPKFL